MFRSRTNIPEQPKVPPMPDLAAEIDRLYLQKCEEVNELERKVEKYKSMAEIAVKKKRELEDMIASQEEVIDRQRIAMMNLDERLAAEVLTGFTPDVEPPEELPEELMEELPLWALQPVTAQDILCLSSALKNLYEIHKCDGWLLYNSLAKVLEQKIKEYCGED